jgi:hypothetical protein
MSFSVAACCESSAIPQQQELEAPPERLVGRRPSSCGQRQHLSQASPTKMLCDPECARVPDGPPRDRAVRRRATAGRHWHWSPRRRPAGHGRSTSPAARLYSPPARPNPGKLSTDIWCFAARYARGYRQVMILDGRVGRFALSMRPALSAEGFDFPIEPTLFLCHRKRSSVVGNGCCYKLMAE